MLRRKKQSGFTIVEVLVAFVILSIGILGAIAMQGNVLRFSKEAEYRTAVNHLLGQMFSQIREANFNARFSTTTLEGARANIVTSMTAFQAALAGADADACDRSIGTIQAQANCLQSELSSLLPDGRIERVAVPGGLTTPMQPVVVTVSWAHRNLSENEAQENQGLTASGALEGGRRIETWSFRP